jgi:pectin methylesterase-like acyl-CoA thioesterase
MARKQVSARSAAVRASWDNPKTAKARKDRIAVKVVGHGMFKSMQKAVDALKIKSAPTAWIPIRTRLKKEKRVKWNGFTFVYAGHPADYVWD